jgi:hypothetical protein
VGKGEGRPPRQWPPEGQRSVIREYGARVCIPRIEGRECTVEEPGLSPSGDSGNARFKAAGTIREDEATTMSEAMVEAAVALNWVSCLYPPMNRHVPRHFSNIRLEYRRIEEVAYKENI